MTAPPSAFAEQFRQHAIPRIRPRIGAYAHRVFHGGCTFSEAVSALIWESHSATLLDAQTFGQFQDWLCAQLTQQIAVVERVAEDIRRTEAKALRLMQTTEAELVG